MPIAVKVLLAIGLLARDILANEFMPDDDTVAGFVCDTRQDEAASDCPSLRRYAGITARGSKPPPLTDCQELKGERSGTQYLAVQGECWCLALC